MASFRTDSRFGVVAPIVLLITAVSSGAEHITPFAGGTGEPNDPYQITTAEQLIAIGSDADLLDKHFVLIDDIDLDPNLPGGRIFSQSLIAPELRGSHGSYWGFFLGGFDGGGHVIRNLVIHTERGPAAGLFGYIDSPAQIRRLGLEGVDIRRLATGVPAFVGGGLVAVNEGGTILACYAIGSVLEEKQREPRAWDAGSSAYDRIGGLVGANDGLVHACYALGNVRGNGIVGGLIGQNDGAVHFSFAAGALEGTGWVGGLIGRSDTGTVINSYWDAETSGTVNSDEGLGKTSAEMMSRKTYEPWVYTGAWTLNEGNDYPRLLWEQASGSLIGDVPPGYGGGSGDPVDPYQIHTAEEFMAIGYRPGDFDKSFALTADLDFTGVDCNQVRPIGFEYLAFSGEFDGQSNCLSNLAIVRPDGRGVGVFGVVGSPDVFPRNQRFHYLIEDDGRFGWGYGGSFPRRPAGPPSASIREIRNLHLQDVTITGEEYVGGLVGLAHGGVVDCSASGQVTGLSVVGGLIGWSLGGTLSGSNVDAEVSGEFAVGGLAGCTWTGNGLTLQDCRASGSVTGQLHSGGLIGFSQSDLVSRCAALCDVRGRYFAGGCFGSTTASTIAASCARGTVTAESWTGGFAGEVVDATVSDSYCQGDVIGETKVGGFAGRCNQEHISRCYSVSPVTASNPDPEYPSIGAFVAHAGKLSGDCVDGCPIDILSCFWDAEVCTVAEAIGNRPTDPGTVSGLPTIQMQTAAPFLTGGWDFESVWMICEGADYPRLQWENVACGDEAIAGDQ